MDKSDFEADKYVVTPSWGAFISLIAVFSYFSFWIFGPRSGFNPILGYLWFAMVAWIILIFDIVNVVRLMEKNNNKWKDHAISAIVIGLCYIAMLIGLSLGYMITA